MKKKAGIITWCDNNGPTNYGQILQCYAMQSIFRKLGFDVIIIQYRKKTERDLYMGKFKLPVLNQLYEELFNVIVIEKTYDKRVRRFRKFIRKNIALSRPCYCREDVEAISESCDILVCGSDQIWNPVWFDPLYGLEFGNENQRRIAYAPSGIAMEDESSLKKYRRMLEYIEKIDFVSVREARSAEILKQYTDKKIEDVLDPTFLLEKDEWDRISSKRLVDEPYVFCYIMGSVSPYKLVLEAIMRKHNVKKIVLIPSNLNENRIEDAQLISDAGPAEFISLIKYAEAVCTDSFHGTALSVKYEKQFYTLRRAQSDTNRAANYLRIDNIMSKMHINDRLVNSIEDVNHIEAIDYDHVNEFEKNEVDKSKKFLENALK